jgi:dolichol kinase
MNFFDLIYNFFYLNTPDIKSIFIYSPIFLILIIVELNFAGFLKIKKNAPTGISRKTFHFLTFFSVAIIHLTLGLKIVCLYGACCVLVVLLTLYKGEGNRMFEAMARETDHPYKRTFIIIPLLSTFLGGLFSNIYFPAVAICGYLTAGIGDAVGEVFGSLWGRHKYKPLAIFGIQKYKSYEGSLAVFIFSFIVLCVGVNMLFPLTIDLLGLCLLIALCTTLVEAFSPPACDNFLMMITPNAMVYFFLFL